jgi:Na+/proline symporter
MSCCLVRNLVSSSMFVLGPSTALSLFLKMNNTISIPLMCAIGTFYTCIGGIKAVIWTDFFQAGVMILSLMFVIVKGVYDMDGVSNVWKINKEGGRLELFDFTPDPLLRQTFWSLYFGGAMQFVISYCFDQQMLQRFKATKTKRKAQTALLLNTPGCILMITLCCMCGMVVYAKYQGCDPLFSNKITNSNQYLSYFVFNSFENINGFMGFYLGALFCSALSSLSSYLNSLASITWVKIFQ